MINTSKPEISIVIPVYNGEKYIEECLSSILHQTFQNWECIIVNDGSIDRSLFIIQKYASEDSRFSHCSIPNSGSAKVPLDLAISLAKSDWIVATAQDDYFDCDALGKMYNRANETKADVVYLRMRLFNDSTPEKTLSTIPSAEFDMSQVISGKEAVMLTIPAWKIGANGALIKKHLWDHRSTLNKGLTLMNIDEYDTRDILIRSQKVAFAETSYHYRRHPNSITKKVSIKLFDTLLVDKMLSDLIKESFGHDSAQYKQAQKYTLNGIIGRQILLMKEGVLFSKEDRLKIKEIIKQSYQSLDKKGLFHENIFKRILLTRHYFLFKISLTAFSYLQKNG